MKMYFMFKKDLHLPVENQPQLTACVSPRENILIFKKRVRLLCPKNQRVGNYPVGHETVYP